MGGQEGRPPEHPIVVMKLEHDRDALPSAGRAPLPPRLLFVSRVRACATRVRDRFRGVAQGGRGRTVHGCASQAVDGQCKQTA